MVLDTLPVSEELVEKLEDNENHWCSWSCGTWSSRCLKTIHVHK
jgi:hypothetical protein